VSRGQELVYRGTCVEEALSREVQFSRTYRLESRVFTLDTTSRGLEIAFQTILKMRGAPGERGKERRMPLVRLPLPAVPRGQDFSLDAHRFIARDTLDRALPEAPFGVVPPELISCSRSLNGHDVTSP
jgi:hypothetical protein